MSATRHTSAVGRAEFPTRNESPPIPTTLPSASPFAAQTNCPRSMWIALSLSLFPKGNESTSSARAACSPVRRLSLRCALSALPVRPATSSHAARARWPHLAASKAMRQPSERVTSLRPPRREAVRLRRLLAEPVSYKPSRRLAATTARSIAALPSLRDPRASSVKCRRRSPAAVCRGLRRRSRCRRQRPPCRRSEPFQRHRAGGAFHGGPVQRLRALPGVDDTSARSRSYFSAYAFTWALLQRCTVGRAR